MGKDAVRINANNVNRLLAIKKAKVAKRNKMLKKAAIILGVIAYTVIIVIAAKHGVFLYQ